MAISIQALYNNKEGSETIETTTEICWKGVEYASSEVEMQGVQKWIVI